jgi:hypothetical protein
MTLEERTRFAEFLAILHSMQEEVAPKLHAVKRGSVAIATSATVHDTTEDLQAEADDV